VTNYRLAARQLTPLSESIDLFQKNFITFRFMESLSIGTIFSVIVGGAITFLASYILEARKLKNEKFKFTIEKTVSVGEEFYRFSAYTLLRLETLLDTYQKIFGYTTQEAANIMIQVDENLKTLLTKIAENNITITSADIFFNVSGADKAAKFANAIKTAEADFQEKVSNSASPAELHQELDNIKKVITDFVTAIKTDREIIRKKILKILDIKEAASDNKIV
jgi:hypothetical protein